MGFQLLFADDSATMHRVVQITLAREQVRILGVNSGRDAVVRARETRPDIAVLDVNMGDMDGYAACQALKDDPSTAHIPVLLLASTQEPLDARRAQECGADGHLTKPFDTQGFIDKLKQTLSQGGHRAPPPAPVAEAPAPIRQAAPAQAAPAAPATRPVWAPQGQGHGTAQPAAAAAAHPSQPRGAAPQQPPQARPPAGAHAAPFAGTTSPNLASSRQPLPSGGGGTRAPQAAGTPGGYGAHTVQTSVRPLDQQVAPAVKTQVHAIGASSAAPSGSANAWKVPTSPASLSTKAPAPSPTARVPLPSLAHAQGPGATGRSPQAQAAGPSASASVAQRLAVAAAPAVVQAMQRAEPAAGGLDTHEFATAVREILERVAHEVLRSAQHPEPGPGGLSTPELMAAAKEILERVAWEVVPPMAESMLKDHIEHLPRPLRAQL